MEIERAEAGQVAQLGRNGSAEVGPGEVEIRELGERAQEGGDR